MCTYENALSLPYTSLSSLNARDVDSANEDARVRTTGSAGGEGSLIILKRPVNRIFGRGSRGD